MNKVYVLPPKEDWIVDRMVKEWNEDNSDMSVFTPRAANVVWLMADWCWKEIAGSGLLYGKKVLTTVHHIVPEKFNIVEQVDFASRDRVTDVYHVFNQHTLDFIRQLTQKPIYLIPYWANQHIWRLTGTKESLRKKHGLPNGCLVGSFQRDTEGSDLRSPKLEKGPDLLCDYLESWVRPYHPDLHVVLAGWRRQYVISRLDKAGISYTYFERPPQKMINELYQTLDLYPVSARQEGGPQALIECGLLGVPCVSRQVGIAQQVLPPSAVCNDLYKAVPAIPNVEAWKIPAGYEPYRMLIEQI